jgi:hypothetical protein
MQPWPPAVFPVRLDQGSHQRTGHGTAVVAVVLVVLSPGLPEGMLSLPRTPEGMSVWHWRVAVLGLLALWCSGFFAQVYRYRHVTGPVERQQAKWVMFILGCFMAIIALGVVVPSLFLDLPDVWFAAVLLASVPLAVAFSISIAFAILRYRLYDIERIISRTLSYGLLTGLLACVYVGLVLILGQLFGGIGAEPPSWAVAGATLAAAALFQPSRRRIQQVMDRRFNRRRYDAAKTMEAFSGRLSEEIDWTRCPSSCWRWWTKRCSLLRRPYGSGRRRKHPRVVEAVEAAEARQRLTPCMPYTDQRPHRGRYSDRAAVLVIRIVGLSSDAYVVRNASGTMLV